MKTAFLHILLALSAVVHAMAQEERVEDKPQEPKGRLAWFIYTRMPDDMENPVSVMIDKDIVPVALSKRSSSDPVKVPADGILRVVRKVEKPKDPDKPEYLTLAQALVPEKVEQSLIILTPVAPNPEGLVFECRVIDLAGFTGGSILYLNMTQKEVSVELGKTKTIIKPDDSKIFNDPAISEPTSMAISYSYYHPEKKEWKTLSSSTIAFYPKRREICLFSWDPRYERIDYHGISFPAM